METVTGIIEKSLFKNKENGYGVYLLKTSAGVTVTITGHLHEVHEGSKLLLEGTWNFHPKFGRQFSVESFSMQLPQSALGIERYLASGLIKGIGKTYAKRLVDRFGEKTLEVIDTQPHLLHTVEGIGARRVDQIIAAWKEQKAVSEVMVFLQERGVSPAFAAKIYKAYGDASISVITSNPYRLVDDIWGVGFKMADGLAYKLGVERDSILRICAGIVYSITTILESGHLYKQVAALEEEVRLLLELCIDRGPALIKKGLRILFEQGKIKVVIYENNHFITLPQYYYAEFGIAKRLLSFSKHPSCLQGKVSIDALYTLLRAGSQDSIQLHEQQQKGIMQVFQEKVSIITGGPGTGKTTLVKTLLDLLKRYNISFRLAAPTGRAAKRMYEGTLHPTETLHRLLEFSPESFGFQRNEQNTLPLDVLIVDEASMIDVFLMHALIKALPARSHLVLLGDIDQLPSVGAGNILRDLIESGSVAVTRLTEIFRQAQDSLIIINAHRVNQGQFPTSKRVGPKRDFVFISQKEPGELFGVLRKLYSTHLASQGIRPQDCIVLTPMNRGLAGTNRINQELQLILNGKEVSKLTRFGVEYRVNDRVMQIRNNYEKFVFNGDIGVITHIDMQDEKLSVQFGERVLEYNSYELSELVLAYAISVHKSQGSEFPAVIIPIFTQHFMLLQRNLLYTAITRAKRLCILVGQPQAIAMAVNKVESSARQTFLQQFLTSDLEAYEG